MVEVIMRDSSGEVVAHKKVEGSLLRALEDIYSSLHPDTHGIRVSTLQTFPGLSTMHAVMVQIADRVASVIDEITVRVIDQDSWWQTDETEVDKHP